MFEVVVCGEKEFSRVEFGNDAADRPDVAELIPLAALQDYFWRTVLSCIDDGTVSFCPFGGPTEIDYLYFVPHRQVIFVRFRVRYLFELFTLQEDVLRFKVSMGVALIVHK
jgi:hypothetical protein